MRCMGCDRELDPQEHECVQCGRPRGEVQVLTREEKDNFQGVTLENEPAEKDYYEYKSGGPSHRVYVRQVTFGPGKMSFWTKLLIAAVFGFLIFVFLPLALLVFAGISVIWIVFRLISR